MPEAFDAVIVGGGHNGLTCAGYLAKAGLSVCVLERRDVVGGAAVTQEFHPGFRNSTYAYTVGLLAPKVMADLGLERFGLRIVTRPDCQQFFPLPGGDHIILPRNTAERTALLNARSAGEGDALDAFERRLAAMAPVVRQLMFDTPPDLHGGYPDALSVALAGYRARRLGPAAREDLVRLFTMSVADYLDFHFQDEALKGSLAFDAAVGNFQSPHSAGSAYVLLHHVIGELEGETGLWGHAIGGMGAITQALAKSAAAAGAVIRTGVAVREILVEDHVAGGIVLEDGTSIQASVVVGNVHPKMLYLDMLDPAILPDAFRNALTKWRSASGSLRMNFALSELPDWKAIPGTNRQPHHEASTIICPTVGYIETAFQDAKTKGWSARPIIHMVVPSVLDDGLAPEGRHVASLFCQHFNPELSGGRSWDDEREDAADRIIAELAKYAPNIPGAIIARQINTPLDLERDLGMIGGDIFHGALHLDQLYSMRPAAGYADYRCPVAGLYLCGSGAHPGGGVSGIPGHNAAREVLHDRRRGKRWLRKMRLHW